jgi:hypothetical protein
MKPMTKAAQQLSAGIRELSLDELDHIAGGAGIGGKWLGVEAGYDSAKGGYYVGGNVLGYGGKVTGDPTAGEYGATLNLGNVGPHGDLGAMYSSEHGFGVKGNFDVGVRDVTSAGVGGVVYADGTGHVDVHGQADFTVGGYGVEAKGAVHGNLSGVGGDASVTANIGGVVTAGVDLRGDYDFTTGGTGDVGIKLGVPSLDNDPNHPSFEYGMKLSDIPGSGAPGAAGVASNDIYVPATVGDGGEIMSGFMLPAASTMPGEHGFADMTIHEGFSDGRGGFAFGDTGSESMVRDGSGVDTSSSAMGELAEPGGGGFGDNPIGDAQMADYGNSVVTTEGFDGGSDNDGPAIGDGHYDGGGFSDTSFGDAQMDMGGFDGGGFDSGVSGTSFGDAPMDMGGFDGGGGGVDSGGGGFDDGGGFDSGPAIGDGHYDGGGFSDTSFGDAQVDMGGFDSGGGIDGGSDIPMV